MKKIVRHFIMLLLVLCCGFYGCGKTEDRIPDDTEKEITPETTTTIQESIKPETTTTVVTTKEETIPLVFPRCGSVKLSNENDWLNIRKGPGTSYPRVAKLASGTVITLTGEENGFYKMDFLGDSCYVAKDYIVNDNRYEPFSMELYAHAPSEKVLSTDAERKKVELLDQLVDIRTIDPTIKTNIIFASDDNFTGKAKYPLDICMIQKDTGDKLKKAQELFQEDGYSLLIYDAYRPYSVSVALAEVITNPIYIADPINPSKHNRGAAVDISLVDSDGNELEMPSAMHVFNDTAHRSTGGKSEKAKQNMDYMTEIMVECGFIKYEYEWWHFNDENCYDYPVTDHYFSDFLFSNASY